MFSPNLYKSNDKKTITKHNINLWNIETVNFPVNKNMITYVSVVNLIIDYSDIDKMMNINNEKC